MAKPKKSVEKKDVTQTSAQMLRKEMFIEVDYLSSEYKIVYQQELKEFSSEFAKAHPVNGAKIDAYALIFTPNFPLRLNAIRSIMAMKDIPAVQKILDFGKIRLESTGIEHIAVILELPKGTTLMDFIIKYGALDEKFICDKILPPLFISLAAYAYHKVQHGTINPNKIYYNPDNQDIKLIEPISTYPGYNQDPSYEIIERIQVPIYAKGAGNTTCDYYALGMLVFHLICGAHPQWNLPADIIYAQRFHFGSYSTIIEASEYTEKLMMTKRMNNLLMGLLTDHSNERWNIKSLLAWQEKMEVPTKRSRLHKESSTPIVFDGIEYTSRKNLAHNIFKKWSIARRTLKIGDLSRWAGLALKDQLLAEQLEAMDLGAKNEIVMPEDRLMRVIMTLDPEGPIRFQDFSCNIFGVGDYLAYNYLAGHNDKVQTCAKIIGDGLIEVWVRRQKDIADYTIAKLGWSPRWAREHLRKKGLGFGLERILYELNHSIPCQSDVLKGKQILGMSDLLKTLDSQSDINAEKDPLDRHMAAFIASRVGMEDELKIKSLINFPYIGKLPQVIMVGFFALAQSTADNIKLPNLSGWIAYRLKEMLSKLNSKTIKEETSEKLRKAAESGNIKEIYQVVANPLYVKKDLYGYEDAKKKYFSLGVKVTGLRHKLYIQLRAYNEGLRYAVAFSIFCLFASCMWALLRL
jgi:eukaryotic-like serine/threonine-protein kinase